MTTRALAVLAVAGLGGACGHKPPPIPATAPPRLTGATEKLLPLLPPGAQVVIELDLGRLRHNPVVGAIATRALTALGAPLEDGTHTGIVPGLPALIAAQPTDASPLADADAVVLAAYGVGTPQAATITMLATHSDVAGGRRLGPELVVLGPPAWLDQVAARVAIDARTPLAIDPTLRALRDHAKPDGASGATLRVAALLSFDARVALARQTGLPIAPAQLAVWGDIADDVAVVVDADAADPGDKSNKKAIAAMADGMRRALATLADEPAVRMLGLPGAIENARMTTGGTWVRAVVTIGPLRLKRVVERASQLIGGAS